MKMSRPTRMREDLKMSLENNTTSSTCNLFYNTSKIQPFSSLLQKTKKPHQLVVRFYETLSEWELDYSATSSVVVSSAVSSPSSSAASSPPQAAKARREVSMIPANSFFMCVWLKTKISLANFSNLLL